MRNNRKAFKLSRLYGWKARGEKCETAFEAIKTNFSILCSFYGFDVSTRLLFLLCRSPKPVTYTRLKTFLILIWFYRTWSGGRKKYRRKVETITHDRPARAPVGARREAVEPPKTRLTDDWECIALFWIIKLINVGPHAERKWLRQTTGSLMSFIDRLFSRFLFLSSSFPTLTIQNISRWVCEKNVEYLTIKASLSMYSRKATREDSINVHFLLLLDPRTLLTFHWSIIRTFFWNSFKKNFLWCLQALFLIIPSDGWWSQGLRI